MTADTPGEPESAGGRFYPLIDCRCSHRDHDRDGGRVYRTVGDCRNCRGGPFLLLVTFGHERPARRTCPRCGCRDVWAERLAEDDELPASSSESS